MPLDINDFRVEKGGNVEKLKASQRARHVKDGEEKIDAIIALDQAWRKSKFDSDQGKKTLGQMSKEVGKIKKAKGDASALIAEINQKKDELKQAEAKRIDMESELKKMLGAIGNYVHESVPVSKDEKDQIIVKKWGECKQTGKELHHHELMHMIGGYDAKRGSNVAGHRGYYLTGPGVLLNQALQTYGLQFLMKKGYSPVQPPYFMKKDIMSETAQLEEFDEALYHVGGEGDDEYYLIATSEQPISAFHRGEWLKKDELPIQYAGVSTCFRKEAGSYGRDSWGLFRVHQFEKIEQFILCAPDKSDEMLEEMIAVACEFYESLGLSYHVATIVSAELNNAASKKYDLEAWFPTLGLMRELVSASNCTDYQARAMETRFGQKSMGDREKQYVHMLNATLCATERTMCCIMENYQTEEGVTVPEVLRPFMGGMEFMPFVKAKPINQTEINSKNKAKNQKKKQPKAQPAAEPKPAVE